MTLQEFKGTLNQSEPDRNWPVQLQALWFDANGDWKRAHDLIDHLIDRRSARVHAYLHRVEGDEWNARYWYGQAGEPEFTGGLQEEQLHLLERFIDY